MSDFDNAMKKISEVLYTAARKSGEILENTKISYTISGEKEKIAKIQCRVGAKLYQMYKTSEPDAENAAWKDFMADFEEIAGIEKIIAEMEKTAAENRLFKCCTECSAKLDPESVYCPRCGAKLSSEPKPDETTPQE